MGERVMEDLQIKYLDTKYAQVRIPIKLIDFERLALDVIKRDTGVDLSGHLNCDYDEDTYFIYTQISYSTPEDDIDRLGPYNPEEWYLTTEAVLASFFGLDNDSLACIYTSEDEVEASQDGTDDLFCHVYVDYNTFIQGGIPNY